MPFKLISVIMSVYNSSEYLSLAIESVLNQEYRNFEFIIVNDGSTDDSLAIIKHYMNLDERIVLINQKNKGLTKSLNIAIENAKGDYIARQDSDDISKPKRFMNFMNFIMKNGSIEIYSTPAYIINELSEIKRTIPNFFRRNGFDEKLLNYYNSMIHGALIVDSKILKKHLYDEYFYYSQDFELYHRLIKNDFHITYDKNNITYLLRHHKGAISSKNGEEQNKFYKSIFILNNKKYFEKSILNRLFFKVKDIQSFIKVKIANK